LLQSQPKERFTFMTSTSTSMNPSVFKQVCEVDARHMWGWCKTHTCNKKINTFVGHCLITKVFIDTM
jgi:hypothetical protein